jgi:hypothetical protein
MTWEDAMKASCRIVFVAGFVLATWLPTFSRAERTAPDSVIGTVRNVDTATRTLEVMTGVGHAVRVMRIEVAPDCDIRMPGAEPGLESLRRGACVRIEYTVAPSLTAAPARWVAVAIEALRFDERGGAR